MLRGNLLHDFMMIKTILLLALLSAEIFARTSLVHNRSVIKILESGDFARLEELLSEKRLSPVDIKYYTAWFFLHTGEYSRGAELVGHLDERNFLRAYLKYMSALERRFLVRESDRFRIRYFGEDERLVEYALKKLEIIYDKNGRFLGYFPEDLVLIEIYPDKESFAAASTLGIEIVERSGVVGICKFNRIMLLSPRNLPLGYRWLDTLSHEYLHFLINRVTAHNCPLWLHEGVAKYTDTLWRSDPPVYLSDYSAKKLHTAAAANKLIPFDKMSPSLAFLPTREDISLAFAQVGDFVAHIVRNYGSDAIAKWLSEMRVDDEKAALRKVTKKPFNRVYKKWLDDIKTRYDNIFFHGIPDVPDHRRRSEDEHLSVGALGHIRLGDMLRKRGNNQGALTQYKKAYEKDMSPVAAVKLARVKIALGQTKEAKELLLRVIEGNQHYITPYLVLLDIAIRENNDAQIKHYAHEAFSINPFYPGLYDMVRSIEKP